MMRDSVDSTKFVGTCDLTDEVKEAVRAIHAGTDSLILEIRRRVMDVFPGLDNLLVVIHDREGRVATVIGNVEDIDTAILAAEGAKALLETQKVKS